MSFDLVPYDLALRSPMATAHRIVGERRGALLQLVDGDVIGWGDACPMPGWSSHDIDALIGHLTVAAARFDGAIDDALDHLEAVPEARAALAGAAHDVTAQRAGLPLAAHLAAAPLERVAVNATIGAADVSTALTNVNLAIAHGITTIKLKVAHRHLDADLTLIEGARRAMGADGEIRLDANGGWRAEEAAAALDAAAPFDIAFCEEPTSGIDAIAALGADSPIPLAVDESARTVDDVARALGTGAIDVVIVKPQALGGPDLAMRAIGLAHQVGATPIVTSMVDSAIGVAHAVHVAAASGVEMAHGIATSTLLASDVARPLPVEDGHVVVPAIPGLGVRPSRTPR
ncbi:MAG: enolase C-terminal domain-like protein [Actinomycetota bacterium]